jgi:hypothetical protein
VRLEVADMRELPDFGEFDLVWALDDAVNYLHDSLELRAALAGMRRNLAADGLLLFDSNTLGTYRTFFAETEVQEQAGRKVTWNGRTSREAPPGVLAEAVLEVEAGEAGAPALRSAHRQRHFPSSEVLDALAACRLECLDIYGHGADAVLEQPLDELGHNKAIYIARRDPGV